MSRFARRNRRNAMTIPEITLTPLIDTALTLLVIFMVTSPLLNNGIKIDLPKGKVQETKGLQEDLVVYIDKERKLYLNEKQLNNKQLHDQLKQKIAHQKNKTIFVKGDGKVEYQEVIAVVEQVKKIEGVDRVALATAPAVA